MDYLLKSGPVKKDRYRIGFLDDNQNHDFHIQIMMGIIEAAKEFDVDIIRFSYYSSHIAYKFTHQVDMVLDHIEQYELDGLLFLGWTRAGAMYNRSDFLSRFGSIPLLSIGSDYEDIPSVYFSGNTYIGDITRHLINKHHFSRIALIDHPRTDDRKDAYKNAMEYYGIYDPRYYVSDTDLEGYDVEDRNERAVQILLEERKLDVEAIISLNVIETGFLLNALEARGIKVPGDIAITSYEDGEIAQYLSPGFTTVYFPFRELGYNGCKNIVKLLTDGQIPLVTKLNSTIIYRESCGCLPESVRNTAIHEIRYAEHSLAEITEDEKDSIISWMEFLHNTSGMDCDRLVKSFITACNCRDGALFLSELGSQLRRCQSDHNVESLMLNLRKLVYPYLLKDADSLQWAGDLIQQSQVYVSERSASSHGISMVEANKIDQMLQDISNSLLVNFSLDNIIGSLEGGLPKLNIPGCLIFISSSIFNDTDVEENLFGNSVLALRYQNGRRQKTMNTAGSLKKQLSVILSETHVNISFAYLLHVTDEVMGFALFEPGPLDESIYQILSTNISTALRGLVLMDRLNGTFSKLVEHARREGMADIAADILHNIGNILNSISVSIHLMEEGSKSTVLDDLIRAGRLLGENMDRLEEFICSDTKGKKLMQFYLKLGTAANRLQDQLRFNVERLQSKIGAINETIAAQQNYAGIDMKFDELLVEPILDDAIKVNIATFDKFEINIVKNVAVSFKAVANRAKLFFIIVNIISNAKDAMSETNGVKRTLTVSMYEDGSGKVLRFDDTGAGIRKDLLDKVFEYGFSSRTGRYGYGLHNCAVYMNEINGSIKAESKGPGRGASFILRFA
jgi:DNA-binding LacI/PurR family transcriptional regulator/signal transduction histidine kinase